MVESSPPGAEKLAEFFHSTDRQITPELSEILEVVATTGKVWHDWEPLRALIAVRMDSVLDTYNKSRLAVDVGPPRPLFGGESFEGLQTRLHALLDATTGPPFTIQRLCEVLLWPHEMYTSIDKLALALEKLLMVTQTVPRSSDPYPALPLPPHQPLPPRRPNPQPMQPRLSFGHQPHPEANPDQVEEHELNLHQNHQLHPNGPLHRPEGDPPGGKAVPSFLEADGPAREALGGSPGHLAKYFEGPGAERRPLPGDASPVLELGHSAVGASEAARRKRSFEETMAPGGPYRGQAEAVEGVREGGLHVVLGSDVTRALIESGSPPGVPGAAGGASPSEAREHGTFEVLLKPEVTDSHGDGDVSMDEGFPVDVVALPAADAPLPELSIEPMTPPSIKDEPGVRESLSAEVDKRSSEGLVEEQGLGSSSGMV